MAEKLGEFGAQHGSVGQPGTLVLQGLELKLLLCLALYHYVAEYPDVMGELGDIIV